MNMRRYQISSKSRCGFGLTEILIGLVIAGIFGGLSVAFLTKQAKERRYAEAKVGLELLHNRAQQAVKRYMSYAMEGYIDANSALRDCFQARGGNCRGVASSIGAFSGFPSAAAGSREAELNLMMNGDYFYNGRPCNTAPCPVSVRTTWNFSCQGMSCTQVTFNTKVEKNGAYVGSVEEKSLFAPLAPLDSEAIYNKTKQVGLVRSMSANCGVPTEANLQTQVMGCDTNVEANNPNELFDSNIGVNFLNGDLQLVAGGTTTGGTTGGRPKKPPIINKCPACTTAVMTNNGLECQPSVLCTNPGWVVRDCKCCQPRIPGGGDGWGSWGACTAACAPGGTQTRTCLYPKRDYCDSVCDVGETETRVCNTQPCCRPFVGKQHIDSISTTWPSEFLSENNAGKVQSCWGGFPSNWCSPWANKNCCGRGATATMQLNSRNNRDCEPYCSCN